MVTLLINTVIGAILVLLGLLLLFAIAFPRRYY